MCRASSRTRNSSLLLSGLLWFPVYPDVHKKQSINKNLLAHPWVLQSFTTSAILSQYPPYFSSTTLVLVLTIFPPPQDLSHFENSVHGPHTQGTKNNNKCK